MMVRYFAYYDENGVLVSIGTVNSPCAVYGEITAEEYERLKASIPEPVEPADPIDEALAILHGEVTE